MAKQKSVNPNILVSGCGISYGAGELPTWIKVLKICGLEIKDLTGPGITNGLILNLLIEELLKNQYSHVICQLTNQGKLDVELNNKNKINSNKENYHLVMLMVILIITIHLMHSLLHQPLE